MTATPIQTNTARKFLTQDAGAGWSPDATITYDRADAPTIETFETILVNRAHATWIDLDDAADDASRLAAEPMPVYHASRVKDFTGA